MYLYENLIKEDRNEFVKTLEGIANKYKIGVNDFMMLFYFETAGTMNHLKRNIKSGAVGLIQFMPSTLKNMGYTVQDLKDLGNVAQLKLVDEYLKPYKNKIRNFYDLYFAVFYPIAIGKADSWVLKSSGQSAELIAKYNPIFDLDKNGQVQVKEVKERLNKHFNLIKKKDVPKSIQSTQLASPSSWMFWFVIIALLSLLLPKKKKKSKK